MTEVLDRTYHIILEVDVDNPLPPTSMLVHQCMGHSPDRTIDDSFYLYSPEDSQRNWIAITVEQPYDHEDSTYYTPVVPAELEDIEHAVSRTLSRVALSGSSILDYENTTRISKVESYDLYKTSITVEESNPSEKHYDRYHISLYFLM